MLKCLYDLVRDKVIRESRCNSIVGTRLNNKGMMIIRGMETTEPIADLTVDLWK